jgi:hypothetical protein
VGGGTVVAVAATVATLFFVRSREPASRTAEVPSGVTVVNLQ